MERRTPLVTGSTQCTQNDGNRMIEPRFFGATDFVNFFLLGYAAPCEVARHVWPGGVWPLLKSEEKHASIRSGWKFAARDYSRVAIAACAAAL